MHAANVWHTQHLSSVPQLMPQPPQLFLSPCVQLPLQQYSPGPHCLPHEPQLFTSLSRLKQPPALAPVVPADGGQHVFGDAHAGPLPHEQTPFKHELPLVHAGWQELVTQRPMKQPCPFGHACVHEPQWNGSFERLKQPPGPPFGPCAQHVCALVHAPPPSHEHTPFAHVSPGRHAWPHEPQLFTSPVTSTQLEPQHVCPAAHAVMPQRHCLFAHVSPL